MGLADQAGDQGNLSLADVRSPGRRRHGPHARPQHPRRSAAGLAESPAEDQPGRQRQAERVPRIDPRHREAHRARVEGRAHRGLAADAGAARHAAPGERAAAERSGSHEAHARSDRARVPDGQDAHRDADAQQRPVADELQVPRRRAGRAAPRPHAQREGRRQGSDVPEDESVPHRAVRLPHAAHEGDQRGRRHAARQLDPHVRLEPVRRRRPRREPAADPAHRQGRRDPQDRPHPRLPRARATTSGRRAACTCRSWTAWASSWTASATRRRGWKICR